MPRREPSPRRQLGSPPMSTFACSSRETGPPFGLRRSGCPMPTDARAPVGWRPRRPRLRPLRLLAAWVSSAVALLLAAALLPGVHVNGFAGALLVVAIVAVCNAVLPPLVAALRLPFTVLSGFLLVLVLDAGLIALAATL